ncbi:MAG: hypothetical protein WC055_02310 [Melioribacteraceae bacterium]
MAVSPPDLTIELTKSAACDTLYLADVTGVVGVNNNTTGYGISGGPTVNNVTQVVVVLTYNSLNTYITYDFTILNGVITGCELSIEAGTPALITGNLTSTVWPFASTLPFNLFGDYGVVIPSFVDDIYTCTYTISGATSTPENFEFETEESLPVICAVQLCVNQKFAGLDWNCEFASEKAKQALLIQTYISQVAASMALDDLTSAKAALLNAQNLCDTAAGGCGCS